jgi:sec1 family domain-containing protein 1
MLHLNLQQQEGQGEEEEEEAYKILVMDSHCVSILSPVLRVNDLRRHGVTLHLGIDRPRQAVPDAPAVYLVRPTPANADRVAADAAAGLYASFYLNFSTSLPRPLLDRLAAACAASQAAAQRVARVADQYLDFVCLEEGLFSLAQPRAYVALNDPAAADADIIAISPRSSTPLPWASSAWPPHSA